MIAAVIVLGVLLLISTTAAVILATRLDALTETQRSEK